MQPPDEGEGQVFAAGGETATGHELQWAVVVEQLGHLAHARQHFAAAHHGALAIRADGVGALGAAEFDRRAATRARGPVVALGGVGGHF